MLAGVAELHAEGVLDARLAHRPVDGTAARATEHNGMMCFAVPVLMSQSRWNHVISASSSEFCWRRRRGPCE